MQKLVMIAFMHQAFQIVTNRSKISDHVRNTFIVGHFEEISNLLTGNFL